MTYIYDQRQITVAKNTMSREYMRDFLRVATELPDGRLELTRKQYLILHRKYRPRQHGLGTFIETVFRVSGIKWARKLMKKPCGCGKRKAKLNRLALSLKE